MRRYVTLAGDLVWVALSAILAVLIRDNFVIYESHFEAVLAYMAITVATAAPIFVIAGLHNRLWQYTSLGDFLRIVGAVTIALLAAVAISFMSSRLEGVARSVPVIQWFLLVGAMVGTRILARIWSEHKRRDRLAGGDASVEHVLVVGVSHVTELYLQSVAEYSAKAIEIAGILSDVRELRGRSLRFHKVLGGPEDLQKVVDELEVHGITVDRIVVTQAFDELSREACEALSTIERSGVQVDWLVERLGLTRSRNKAAEPSRPTVKADDVLAVATSGQKAAGYGTLKRVIDIGGAFFLSILFAPVMLVVSLLVALDVGFPLVFWQKRPGRFGRPFRLYKFSTMRSAHDAQGRRLPDDARLSTVGRILRRTRLDELPQLYNILIGEMSFVGPRPLLLWDQPEDMELRLSIRPGLTGLAQVHGERDMPPEDKNALDVWYIQNASLWLDIRIALRTMVVFIRGERVDQGTLRLARAGLERLKGAHDVEALTARY